MAILRAGLSLEFRLCARWALVAMGGLLLVAMGGAARGEERVDVKAWPLVYHAVDPEAGTDRLEIAWPLVDIRTAAEHDPWKLLHAFQYHYDPVRDNSRTALLFNLVGGAWSADRWRLWLFPLLWTGKSPSTSHFVLFPFYGRYHRGNTYFNAWTPAFVSHAGNNRNDRGYLFLVWQGERTWKTDTGQDGRRSYLNVFPLVWNSATWTGETKDRSLHAFFPLYHFSENQWQREGREGTTWSNGGFYLVWFSGRREANAKTGANYQERRLSVWPLFSDFSSQEFDAEAKTHTEREVLRALGPLVKSSERIRKDEAGQVLLTRHAGRAWPLVFWKHAVDHQGKEISHRVVFPLWWDFRRPGSSVQALVPVGARLADEKRTALNVLGPLFTRLDQKEKGYVRYDALFPIFMIKQGKDQHAFRLWPLYNWEVEDGKRCQVGWLWPLVSSEVTVDVQPSSPLGQIFGAPARASTPPAPPTGQVDRWAFPFFFEDRRNPEASLAVFPFCGRSLNTSPDYRETSWWLLAGAWFAGENQTTLGSHWGGLWNLSGAHHDPSRGGYHAFPLFNRSYADFYSPWNGCNQSDRDLRVLLLYNQQYQRQVPVAGKTGATTVYEQTFPFIFRHETRATDGKAAKERDLALFWLPFTKGGLLRSSAEANGESYFSLLNPLWTARRGDDGHATRKSLGGLAFKGETDACGFSENRLFYRLWRNSSNSRRSSWELMPLAFGGANLDGEWHGALLGGLLGIERNRTDTTFRFLFLPVIRTHHKALEISETEALARARQHLEYGLRYLDHGAPDRALVELALARPAFGNQPALFEKLGDAFRHAICDGTSPDVLEKVAADIEYFSSAYPAKLSWEFSPERDLRLRLAAESRKAYSQAQQLGGDSPLLRRKMIANRGSTWLPDKDKERENIGQLYADARQAFPTDFSLNWDEVEWRAATPKKAESKKLYEEMAAKYPKSATVRARLLQCEQPYPAVRKEPVEEIAKRVQSELDIANMPTDVPAYLPIDGNISRPGGEDVRQECLRMALEQGQNLVSRLLNEKRTEEAEKWLRTLTAVRVAQVPGSHYGPGPNWFVNAFRDLYEQKAVPDEFPTALRSYTAQIPVKEEAAIWEKEIRRAEVELSYLRSWQVLETGSAGKTPRPIQLSSHERFVDLRRTFTSVQMAAVDAQVTLKADQDQTAMLLVGFAGEAVVSLNGQEILHGNHPAALIDEHVVPVSLRAGENHLDIRLTKSSLAWGFSARLTTPDGKPIR